MTNDRSDDEPTMDEILTSIRKIIADEDDEAGDDLSPRSAGKTTSARRSGAGDVLELTEKVEDDVEDKPLEPGPSMAMPAPAEPTPPSQPTPPSPQTPPEDEEESKPLGDDEVELIPLDATRTAGKGSDMDGQQDDNSNGLLSDNASAASTASFAKLAQSAKPQNDKAPLPAAGQSVDQLVRELMRAPLKDWLDANLQAIVERVVEEEVKKLAKRAELQ